MANGTIAQVPANITDETSLRRFLVELVGNLNIVLGYSGNAKYVSENQLSSSLSSSNTTLASLSSSIKDNADAISDLADTVGENTDSITELSDKLDTALEGLQYVSDTQELTDVSYFNFQNTVWSDVKGKSQLTGTGASFANPPFTLDGGTSYTFYTDTVQTVTDIWQTAVVYDPATSMIRMFVRLALLGTWYEITYIAPPTP